MAGLKPLGQVLVARGVLDEVDVNAALERQAERLRLASLCYALGYAGERPLAEALSEQTGWPAVIFDESVVELGTLDAFDPDWLRTSCAFPVFEDRRRVVVAVADPDSGHAIEREIERLRGGRSVELHIALEVTLMRALRHGLIAHGGGQRLLAGAEVAPEARRTVRLVAVTPDGGGDAVKAHRAVFAESTRELIAYDDLPAPRESSASISGRFPGVSEWGQTTTTTTSVDRLDEDTQDGVVDDTTLVLVAEIDQDLDTFDGQVPLTSPSGAPSRVLVVDGDPAAADRTTRELEQLGYTVDLCTDGSEAIRILRTTAIDLVIADVMVPQVDGFRLCRVVKKSRRLAGVPVILTASVIDAGPISQEVLASFGVDGFLEKPLDPRYLVRAARELIARRVRASPGEPAFAEAMGRYQAGDLDGAIASLRAGIDADPGSAKHRFVLANLLQRKAMVAEAIDEYETVVELQPDYFPALTRLAYLYYRQGHLARAVETWRRSLPVCDDDDLRRNIELFMRKLITDLSQNPTSR